MALSLQKIKSVFNSNKNNRLAGSGSADPEIGFKLVFNSVTKCLYVTVIGARHLPSLFGLSSAKGYLVKVKVFPGTAKFESKLQETSWPVWDEEFKFQIGKALKPSKKQSSEPTDLESLLAGHFISLTVYAVLDTAPPKPQDKKKKTPKTVDVQTNTDDSQSTSKLAKFEQLFKDTFKNGANAQTDKPAADKRRTIGAATWSFDKTMFQNNLKYDLVGTPDIWRPIVQISGGVSRPDEADNKKGQVEICLLYSKSENGANDTIQINVNKMRCNIQTMQDHELHKAPLYLKAAISDRDKECHWKSDRFDPTISARWDPKSSCVRLPVNPNTLSHVSIYISLGCKNSMGVKEILGKLLIGEKSGYSAILQQAIKSPGVPKTEWLYFDA